MSGLYKLYEGGGGGSVCRGAAETYVLYNLYEAAASLKRTPCSPASYVLLVLAALLAGCPDPVPPQLFAIQERVFTPSCAFSSCHSSAGHAGELVLERGASFAQLVGRQSSQFALARVAAGQPDQSLLVIKLRPGTPAGLGEHMPRTGGQIDDDALAAIVEWIRRGAPDD